MISWDVETTGLSPDADLVCLSYATDAGPGLLLKEDGLDYLEGCLELGDVLVGHNVAQDFCWAINSRPRLLKLVFDAYENNRVHDTLIREKLLNIADGTLRYEEDDEGNAVAVEYSLDALSQKYGGKALDKGQDSWRTRYAELVGVPIDAWPVEAVRYAKDDAVSTLYVARQQARRANGSVTNEFEQVRAAFCLKLMSNVGMITDPVAVAELEKQLTFDYERLCQRLIEAGLMRAPRPYKSGPRKGELTQPSKDMAAITERVVRAYEAHNLDLELTATGRPSTSRKTLKLSRDPALEALAEYGAIDKVRGTYLPILRDGSKSPIHAGFNVLVATGRTSSFAPNFQNLPRDGGVRDCLVPRPGWVFVFCDYSAIELRTLAQACLYLGLDSELARAFNSGVEVHLAMAAEMLGISYEEALKRKDEPAVARARQAAKALNFGFPGGLGAAKFVEYAADSYGVYMTLDEAKKRRDQWFKRWPEMKGYFKHVEKWSRQKWVKQFVSNRIRGGTGFCDSANSPFQGLAADGIKHALWLVTKAAYCDPQSVLYGSRPVNMVHDEIIIEAPEDSGAEAAEELSRLMILGMSHYVPDVKIETSLAMARRWYKAAKEVRDSSGKLVCWEPKRELAA